MANNVDVLKKRSATPAGNFEFEVQVLDLSGTMALELPVNAVRGLGDGRTNVIRHRANPFGAATQTPYPGLSVPDNVTLEGHWFYDAGDVKLLKDWRDQCIGKAVVSPLGYFRDVQVLPNPAKEDGTLLGLASASYKLINCVAVNLRIDDFDINNPRVSFWQLELAFEDMLVQ